MHIKLTYAQKEYKTMRREWYLSSFGCFIFNILVIIIILHVSNTHTSNIFATHRKNNIWCRSSACVAYVDIFIAHTSPAEFATNRDSHWKFSFFQKFKLVVSQHQTLTNLKFYISKDKTKDCLASNNDNTSTISNLRSEIKE